MFNLLFSFNNLLADGGANAWMMPVFLLVLLGGMFLWTTFSGRKRKKQQEEEMNMLAAIRPGHKVITIGGISGIVVEKNDEEGTFVLETGTEKSGKSFIKFYNWAIRESDAFEEYIKAKEAAKKEQAAAEAAAVEAAKKAKEEEKAAKKAAKDAKTEVKEEPVEVAEEKTEE